RDGGRAGRLEGARGARAGSGVRERRGPASGGGGRKTPAGPGRDGGARGHGGQTAATQVGTRTLSPGMLDARGRRSVAGGAIGPDTADNHGTASRTMERARPTAGPTPGQLYPNVRVGFGGGRPRPATDEEGSPREQR